MTASRPRRVVIAAGAAALVVTGLVVPLAAAHVSDAQPRSARVTSGAPGAASRPPRQPPVVAHSRYLALGDSVAFGYRESGSIPAPDYGRARSFIGFPEDVAADLGLRLANAACPGETTTSFIDQNAQSNGCENSFDAGTQQKVPGGYRTVYPLHVHYRSSQLRYAVSYLRAHPRSTRLVSLMIGANDGFLCQKQTSDQCVSELGTTVATVQRHVARILRTIRAKARYGGQIALVTYYTTDYSNSVDVSASRTLNDALVKAAKPYRVKIVDGFAALEKQAAQAAGNSCTAGLLTALDPGGCGVHPSVAGQALLAQALERRVRK